MNDPTLHELQALTSDLQGNDWATFADRISERWPALGAYECLHAASADHCSPPVEEWPRHALDDWDSLVAAGADQDPAGAERLWHDEFDEFDE